MENITEEDFKKQRDPGSIYELVCSRCGIKFYIRRWYHDQLKKDNKGRGYFCSRRCALIARNVSQEQRDKISKAQKGISVLSRGRKGKVIPPEVREKIRQSKLGKPSPQDYMIVHTALEALGVKKAAVTKGLVPDAIFVKDGLLTALEVEKKRIESDIRRKMAQYDNRDDYDKVIIMWYDPKGNYLKQWVKYKGEWNLVTL
jgi:hypothetical protein